jgi:hypothetical protein
MTILHLPKLYYVYTEADSQTRVHEIRSESV